MEESWRGWPDSQIPNETCCAFIGVLEPLTAGELRVHQAHRHSCLLVSLASAAAFVILGQDCEWNKTYLSDSK